MLRALVVHASPDLVLARLQELGLSMDFVRLDSSIISDSGQMTPSKTSKNDNTDIKPDGSQPVFRDPLNATQPVTQPDIVLAR